MFAQHALSLSPTDPVNYVTPTELVHADLWGSLYMDDTVFLITHPLYKPGIGKRQRHDILYTLMQKAE